MCAFGDEARLCQEAKHIPTIVYLSAFMYYVHDVQYTFMLRILKVLYM
jgi:hypothetical protein